MCKGVPSDGNAEIRELENVVGRGTSAAVQQCRCRRRSRHSTGSRYKPFFLSLQTFSKWFPLILMLDFRKWNDYILYAFQIKIKACLFSLIF